MNALQRLFKDVLVVTSMSNLAFPLLQAGVQQDSHELLRLLLDGLHDEEVKAARKRMPSKKGQSEEAGLSDKVACSLLPFQSFASWTLIRAPAIKS